MKALEEKILKEGKVLAGGVLKVGSFLNQQIDTAFLKEMGAEIARLYRDSGVNKILTIEASGIAIAVAAAYEMNVPVVFAKKNKSSNVSGDIYSSKVESFTHRTVNSIVVSKEFISKGDRILIVDDFLANGNALLGLSELITQAGATVVGAAIAIEKGFQKGGDELRAKGMRIESLAIVDCMTESGIEFRLQNN
ncbi:MAG: xanthine phosphoribosyltransferase [Clostridia bacterium]|nr:xanthine phosphoribosyltransferase [Clostridia bacterium]